MISEGSLISTLATGLATPTGIFLFIVKTGASGLVKTGLSGSTLGIKGEDLRMHKLCQFISIIRNIFQLEIL